MQGDVVMQLYRSSGILALLAAIGIASAACSSVVETMPLTTSDGSSCHSAGGAYFLPKRLVHMKVVAAIQKGTGFGLANGDPTLVYTADRTQVFCLDYLTLATSQDVIAVQRDDAGLGLLSQVTSNVTDRTPEIAQTLITTAENLAIAAARSGTLEAAPTDTAEFEFDPFDEAELGAINSGLERFGLCVFIEGYSFPETQCAPRGRKVRSSDLVFREAPVRPDATRAGILYRPNLTYKLVILRRASRTTPWTLFIHRTIEMPNISPILSIGVERAMFTQRTTKLTFDHGVLSDVSIHKDSELVGFVKIPLAAAQAIVDLPTQIVQVRINDTNQQASLIQTQSQLLDALKSYQDTVNGGRSASLPQRSATRGAVIGDCTDVGRGQTDCLKLFGVTR